jgi:hypothetical protein
MVSRELTEELQKIIREEFNIDLSFDEASRMARELSGYFDLLAEVNYENTEKLNKLNTKIECLQSNAIIIMR